jgi:hypothetical protein
MRIRVLGVLALAVMIALVGVQLSRLSTPLTALNATNFMRVHRLDAEHYRDLNRGLERILDRLSAQDEIFGTDSTRVLTPNEESLVLDAWVGYIDAAFALDQLRKFYEDYYRFDLSRLEREHHVRSFLLTFASELALYRHTSRLDDLLDSNRNVVRFLNVARPERNLPVDSVAWVREELAGLTDLARVAAGKQYLTHLDRLGNPRQEAVAGGYDWIWGDVERQLAALGERGNLDAAAGSVSSDFAPIKRRLKHLSFPVQANVAEWMGDTRVKRIGRYLIEEGELAAIRPKLSPGDVMLSRKNWYLSNIGLPGFWPHAMIYVGSNDDLAEVFDDDPGVKDWLRTSAGEDITFTRYLAKMHPTAWRERSSSNYGREPLVIIEAISEGVVQSCLLDAAGDYLATLRPRVPLWVKARAIARAFGYLGRPYDFDFDFATDHALVCTEVVWRGYRPVRSGPGLNLPTVVVMGRETLPANEIALAFAEGRGRHNAQFDFVSYIEGREKSGDAVVADVDRFLATPNRSKWSINLP